MCRSDLLSFGSIVRCTVSKDFRFVQHFQISGFTQAKNAPLKTKKGDSIGGSPGAWTSYLKASEGTHRISISKNFLDLFILFIKLKLRPGSRSGFV
jgi:hypothetical protein